MSLTNLSEDELNDLSNIDYAHLMEEQDINDAWQKEEFDSVTALEIFEKGLSKSAINVMAQRSVDSVLQKGNVLEVAEALASMELFIKSVKENKDFKNYAREEISKYPKGFNSNSGAKIECSEVGTKYDYDNCNDPVLLDIELAMGEHEKKINERKSFLKTVPLSGIDIITNEGEVRKIYPPVKTSTSSYKITLAR